MRDLRVSVTDRCNFRCRYCMPREVFGPDHAFLQRSELLTFEEVARVVGLAAELGVRKVRLTGGEPLLRRQLPVLVEMLAAVDGLDDLALTTNGVLLPAHAADLRAAGLHRLTVSLDALDDEVHRAVADVQVPVQAVLDGIDAALAAGFEDVRLNMVVQRGVTDGQVLPLANHAREHGLTLRFIEYMDVGASNAWRMDEVVPSAEVLAQLDAAFGIEPLDARHAGEVAKRWRYRDGRGEVGVISSVTQPFCGDCTRLRLSAVGELFTCLFATRGHDLRDLMRAGADDDALRDRLDTTWRRRTDRYSEERGTAGRARDGRVEMSYIGG